MRTGRAALVLGLAVAGGLGGLLALRARGTPARAITATDPAVLSASIAFFERRLDQDPDNGLLAGQLINRYVVRFGQSADLADVERAEALAQRTVALARDPAPRLARLSGILLMQHEFGPAFERAAESAALDPRSSEAAGALVEAALAAGRYAVADSVAAGLDVATLPGRVRRALYLDAKGESASAFDLMDRACDELIRTASPGAVVAWCLTQLAKVDHALRGPDEAEATLREALRVQPGYRGAIEGLADLAMASGHTARAVAGYREILSDAHPDLYLRLADGLRALGAVEEAGRMEARFVAAASPAEREPLFGNTLALFLAERGGAADLDRALDIARREVSRRPTIESFDLLSRVHYRRGELIEALRCSDSSLTWGAPTATMQWHRGRILAALGREAEASALLSRAEADPTLLAPHARAERARLSTRGFGERARRTWRSAGLQGSRRADRSGGAGGGGRPRERSIQS